MDKTLVRPLLIRLAIISAISFAFAFAFNEASYLVQKDPGDRAPTTISIVIPAGAADKLAAGEDVVALPDEISFVVGDVLEVVNQDTAAHQLGPIFVPPGATGSLVIDQDTEDGYTCSFTSNQYLGLDVRTGTTTATRLIALGLTVPTLAALLFLYSLALYPIRATAPKKVGL